MPIVWTAAAALALIGFAAVPADPVAFKALAAGEQGLENRREAVVRTAAQWTSLWKELGPSGPRPPVDFARTTVLGIFLGSRPTVGFSVKIESIERHGAELVVTYRERPPAPTDMVAQMLTAPYVLVTIEKFDGRVRFVRAP
jgi:PrcB C-terminal